MVALGFNHICKEYLCQQTCTQQNPMPCQINAAYCLIIISKKILGSYQEQQE
jgi:hypothetical protein